MLSFNFENEEINIGDCVVGKRKIGQFMVKNNCEAQLRVQVDTPSPALRFLPSVFHLNPLSNQFIKFQFSPSETI